MTFRIWTPPEAGYRNELRKIRCLFRVFNKRNGPISAAISITQLTRQAERLNAPQIGAVHYSNCSKPLRPAASYKLTFRWRYIHSIAAGVLSHG